MIHRIARAFVSTLALVGLASLFAGCGGDSPDAEGCFDASGHFVACPDLPAPSSTPTAKPSK